MWTFGERSVPLLFCGILYLSYPQHVGPFNKMLPHIYSRSPLFAIGVFARGKPSQESVGYITRNHRLARTSAHSRDEPQEARDRHVAVDGPFSGR